MRKTLLLVVALAAPISFTAFGQDQVTRDSKAVRIDPKQYTIFIANLGKANGSGDSLLHLHNNSIFKIRIPVACCEKRGVPPPEIFPLFRVDGISGRVQVPNLKGDQADGHWLDPGSSVNFTVPAKYSSGHSIYLPFNYEWELDGAGPRIGLGEPEHYVIWVFGKTSL